MKKLRFTAEIKAPSNKVYDAMLGLNDKTTYEAWTAVFNPTSTYEGNWEKGNKMLFVGTAENGEKGGMVSEVVENIPNRFVSIKHYGIIKAGEEITEGPEVEKWAGGLEEYSFSEKNGITTVKVELDAAEDFTEYMNNTFPKSLMRLKELCEN